MWCQCDRSLGYDTLRVCHKHQVSVYKEFVVGKTSATTWVLGFVVLVSLAGNASANGLGENRSWQFDTSNDKLNKAFIVDIIERKKGGFYDGFDNNFVINNFNTTNIGSQVNCNNVANATGNIADNRQAGPQTVSNSNPNVLADSNGNLSDNQATPGGVSNGASPTFGGEQDNSGDVTSSVSDSNIDSGVSGVSNGATHQALDNTQDNSGNQDADVSNSTACSFDGSTISGNVTTDNGPGTQQP